MKIRAATSTDAKAVATVHVASEQAAYRGILPDIDLDSLSVEKQEISWRHRIETRPTDTLVADDEGSIVGWVNFGVARVLDKAPNTAEIRAMYVDPAIWRSGVGTALWKQSRALLKQAGYSSVILWVYESNSRARRFYERVGFSLEDGAEKTIQRGGNELKAVRYRHDLRAH